MTDEDGRSDETAPYDTRSRSSQYANTRLFGSDDVDRLVEMEPLVAAIEDAFAAYDDGTVIMPAKSYVELDRYNGDFRSMPAYLDTGAWDAAGLKWVNVHPENPVEYDLPTVMGTMVYSDPETGYPLAIMDGTALTRLRTGGAAAVATDHLAVENARSLGIIGAGVQAYTQLRAIATVRPIETVVISDLDEKRVQRFVETFDDAFEVRSGTTADAAGCDVLSTVTPVRSPIVGFDDLGPNTHVNAMGADAPGKQELESDVLTRSTLVIDDYEQTTHSGECNVPWSTGELTDEDIAGELGGVVTGRLTDVDRSKPTVFDSTGLAIQDVAAAHVVYMAATESDGDVFELV